MAREFDPHTQHHLRNLGSLIGYVMESQAPAVPYAEDSPPVAIPSDKVEEIVDGFTIVIAEALQAWLDAGSEREVTYENEALHEALTQEVLGWAMP